MRRLLTALLLCVLATAARADNFDIPDARMWKPLQSGSCDMNAVWVDGDGAKYNAVCCELGQGFSLPYRRAPQTTGDDYEGDVVTFTDATVADPNEPLRGCVSLEMACCTENENCTAQTYGDPVYAIVDHTHTERRRLDSFSGLVPGDTDADDPAASCSVIYRRVANDDPGDTCDDEIGTDLLCFIQGNFGG